MRRPLLRPVCLALAGSILAGPGCRTRADAGPAPPQATPPNIVFVLADDLGWGDAACNNPGAKIATPHVDLLAQEGMRFTDAHAPASVCVPSRYGLLTGRFPCRQRQFPWRRQAVIEAGRVTIPSLLRDHGYATAMVGKWHQGFDGGPDHDWSQPLRGGPLDRGFDTWFGIPASLDIPPYYWVCNRTVVAAPTDRIAASHTEGWTDIQGAFWRAGDIAPGFDHGDVLPALGREAVAVIEQRAGGARPFLLYLALTAPHTPWLPLPAHRGTSDAGLYGDFVHQVDAVLGRVLDALEQNGIADNTLVFFTSDNGPVWYPGDVDRFGHRSAGVLRGMKGDAWEGGHRVPFVVRWPGRIPAGTVSDQVVCFTDVMATCADVIGADLPDGAGEDSESFLPVLLGAASQSARDVTILKANASVIRQGRWKLITHLGSGGFSAPRRPDPEPGGPTGQLYDLREDIGETDNLWAERPDIVTQLTRLLESYQTPSTPGGRR